MSPRRSSRHTQRERLFDEGAKAFTATYGGEPGRYVCPLCCRDFRKQALDNGELTLDHVPPSRVPGTSAVLLTCRRCNNTAGTRLESQMLAAEGPTDFLLGTMNGPKSARLHFGEISLNVEILAEGDNVQIWPTGNHPSAQHKLTKELERLTKQGSEGGYQFEIRGFGHRPAHSHAGWLRAAYLVAFAIFGYRYALSSKLNPVRSQVKRPENWLLPAVVVSNPAMPKDERSVVIVQQPDHLRSCVLVRLGRHTIFLPAIDGAVDVYAELSKYKEITSLQLTGNTLKWPAWPSYLLD